MNTETPDEKREMEERELRRLRQELRVAFHRKMVDGIYDRFDQYLFAMDDVRSLWQGVM